MKTFAIFASLTGTITLSDHRKVDAVACRPGATFMGRQPLCFVEADLLPTAAQIETAIAAYVPPAPAPTLLDKLRALLATLHGDAAKARGIDLASAIDWAVKNGHASDIPAMLKAFDPAGDAELVVAKAAALDMLAPPVAARS